jgi:hypothetical protein
MTERQYLLDRCLRLEARLLGVEVAPFDPATDEAPPEPARPPTFVGKRYRKVTAEDARTMRVLREQGLSYYAIAKRLGFGYSTVRVYAWNVWVAPLSARAVGE